MSRYLTVKAIVLYKKTTKENDLVIHLLSQNQGKIIALAKGAQNIKSQRLSALQMGNIIKAQLYQKNDFTWVSQATTAKSFLHSSKNLAQFNLLFYLLEVTDHFLSQNEHTPGIFTTIQKLIESIEANNPYRFLKYQIQLISLLGFGPPAEVISTLNQKDYRRCQRLTQAYLEGLIDHPIYSHKLFR